MHLIAPSCRTLSHFFKYIFLKTITLDYRRSSKKNETYFETTFKKIINNIIYIM